jgi:hypothetical protein
MIQDPEPGHPEIVMLKKSVVAAAVLCALPRVSLAQEDAFTRYADLALATADAAGAEAPDVGDLVVKNESLMGQGLELMGAYRAKFTECAQQYAALVERLGELRGADVPRLEAGYHDGEELPAAPGHCYFGRSLVVHPLMNLARLKDGLTPDEAEAVRHESQEISGHVRRVQKRVGAN